MKKTLILFLMAVLLCGTLFAGGGRQQIPDDAAVGEHPITLQFWNSWTGPDGDTLVAIVNEFNRTNPWQITVEMDISAGAALTQRLTTALPSGEGAELILQTTGNRFRYQEFLHNMNDIWTNTNLREQDFLGGFLDLGRIDNSLYMVPFQHSAMFLYWNRELFRRAGLDPNRPPQSFEEWTSMAERITDPTRNVFGSGLFYSFGGQQNGLMQLAGGLAITEPSPGRYRVNFAGNEGFRRYLTWQKDLFDRGINPLEENVDPMFMAGQIGILINGGWLAAGADRSGIDFEMARIFGNEPRGGLSGFMITNSARSDVVRRTAQKFIEWWYRGNDGSNLATTGAGRWALEIGFPTSYIPLINHPGYQANERIRTLTISDPNTILAVQVPPSFRGSIDAIIGALSQEVVFSPARGSADIQRAIDTALANAQRDAEDIVIQFHGSAALVR